MNEAHRPSQRKTRSRSDPFNLVVCERDGHWARHLRRELSPGGIPVCETRSLQECWRMLDECPAALLLVEVTAANAVQMLAVAAQLGRDYPAARLVVLADGRFDWAKWSILEAGAVWFCSSPRRLSEVAGIARSHRAQVPRPSQSLEQKILDELPWKAPAG